MFRPQVQTPVQGPFPTCVACCARKSVLSAFHPCQSPDVGACIDGCLLERHRIEMGRTCENCGILQYPNDTSVHLRNCSACKVISCKHWPYFPIYCFEVCCSPGMHGIAPTSARVNNTLCRLADGFVFPCRLLCGLPEAALEAAQEGVRSASPVASSQQAAQGACRGGHPAAGRRGRSGAADHSADQGT